MFESVFPSLYIGITLVDPKFEPTLHLILPGGTLESSVTNFRGDRET